MDGYGLIGGLGTHGTPRTPPVPLDRIRARFGLAPTTGGFRTEDDRVRFEERAAIAEYDGGLSRAEAEQLAWQELKSFAEP